MLPFAHITGAHAWKRCPTRAGLVVDGRSGGLRLATEQEDADTGTLDEGLWSAWRARRGGALWRPLGPERCEEREALLGCAEGILRWDGARWSPVEGLDVGPVTGLDADADGVLWVLGSEGGVARLRRVSVLGFELLGEVEVPPGLRALALSADGLCGLDDERLWWRRDGGWQPVAIPNSAGAPVALTRWGDGVAALCRGKEGCALAVVRLGRVEVASLPNIQAGLGLLALPDGDLLVGELVAVTPKRARMRFGRYRREAPGQPWVRLEGWQVVGFDGRALFSDAEGAPWAGTAHGPRRLLRRADTYAGDLRGELITFELDAGTPGTPWHRVFLDVDLPEGTEVRVFARSFDDAEPKSWGPPLAHLERRPGWSDRPFPPRGTPPFETLEGLLPTWPGRHLRLRVELRGTRRASPLLYGLRVTLPRPSLLTWLPAYWRVDAQTLPSFEGHNDTVWGRLERMLALFEGTFTELEARADALPALWDPGAAPVEVLPWLAGLVGWSPDTRVGEAALRLLLQEAAELHRRRGTVAGIRRLCSILADCEVEVIEAFRQRRAVGATLGREAPGPHDTPGAVLGPGLELAPGDSGDPEGWYASYAHHFSVVLGREHEPTLHAVIEHAVADYRPAHTTFELVWRGAGLRLGRGSSLGVGAAPGPGEQELGTEGLILGDAATPLGSGERPTVLPHPASLFSGFPAARPERNRRPT